MKTINYLLFALLISATSMFVACGNSSDKTADETGESNQTATNAADNADTKQMYGIKSGLLVYDMSAQGINIFVKQYFDDFGEKNITITTTTGTMMGQKINEEVRQMRKGGYVYSFTLGVAQGTKTRIGDDESGGGGFRLSEMTDEQKTAFNYKELGTETILGKECGVYSVDSEGFKAKYYMWNDVVLQTEVQNEQGTTLITAKSFDENPTFPDGIFDLPENVEFVEVSDSEM